MQNAQVSFTFSSPDQDLSIFTADNLLNFLDNILSGDISLTIKTFFETGISPNTVLTLTHLRTLGSIFSKLLLQHETPENKEVFKTNYQKNDTDLKLTIKEEQIYQQFLTSLKDEQLLSIRKKSKEIFDIILSSGLNQTDEINLFTIVFLTSSRIPLTKLTKEQLQRFLVTISDKFISKNIEAFLQNSLTEQDLIRVDLLYLSEIFSKKTKNNLTETEQKDYDNFCNIFFSEMDENEQLQIIESFKFLSNFANIFLPKDPIHFLFESIYMHLQNLQELQISEYLKLKNFKLECLKEAPSLTKNNLLTFLSNITTATEDQKIKSKISDFFDNKFLFIADLIPKHFSDLNNALNKVNQNLALETAENKIFNEFNTILNTLSYSDLSYLLNKSQMIFNALSKTDSNQYSWIFKNIYDATNKKLINTNKDKNQTDALLLIGLYSPYSSPTRKRKSPEPEELSDNENNECKNKRVRFEVKKPTFNF